jgi:hypothetical protein
MPCTAPTHISLSLRSIGYVLVSHTIASLLEGEKRLLQICDPNAVNVQCFADQKAKIEALGGEAKCLSAYRFNHSPTPSEQAKMCLASDTPYKPMDS